MKVTKIKMKPGCGTSNNLMEIDQLYLTGTSPDGYYLKAAVYDFLKQNPGSIQVDIFPYPNLIPAISPWGEKYVRSAPNGSSEDNLLKLPRT